MQSGVISKIQKYSTKDGPGIRSTVFCAGCNVRCIWCSNPELIETENKNFQTTAITARELSERLLRDKVFYDQSGGGVTFSGGEPALQPEFVRQTAALLKEAGVSCALDTAGCVEWDVLKTASENMDLILYDIKAADDGVHRSCTGASNALILENAKRLAQIKKLHVRLILVPPYNDGADLEKRLDFVKSLGGAVSRVDILPFHKLGAGKYLSLGVNDPMKDLPECPPEAVSQAAAAAERMGIKAAIGG